MSAVVRGQFAVNAGDSLNSSTGQFSRLFAKRHDLPAFAESIQIVAPPLCHLDPLIPMRAAMIRRANAVRVTVPQRALDGVYAPLAALVEDVASSGFAK